MNRKHILIFAIILLVVIYIYNNRENLTSGQEQEQEQEQTNNFCAPNELQKCEVGKLCMGNKTNCSDLCVSGNSEPVQIGIRKCL